MRDSGTEEAGPDGGPERVNAYVGLGANLGNRRRQIREALRRIDAVEATEVVAVSSIYATEPRIVEDQPEFLNACAKIETELAADKLLATLLDIERRMGRRRGEGADKGARRIDLDLLLYGDAVCRADGLEVPHPGLPERRFVLVPLVEIAARVRHPTLEATVAELLERCDDDGDVRRVDG